MRMGPTLAATSAKTSSNCSRCSMSSTVSMPTEPGHSSRSSPATVARRPACLSVGTTMAPPRARRWQIARPIPAPAPVTSATCPANSVIGAASCVFIVLGAGSTEAEETAGVVAHDRAHRARIEAFESTGELDRLGHALGVGIVGPEQHGFGPEEVGEADDVLLV